jgi:hypothetical protein
MDNDSQGQEEQKKIPEKPIVPGHDKPEKKEPIEQDRPPRRYIPETKIPKEDGSRNLLSE